MKMAKMEKGELGKGDKNGERGRDGVVEATLASVERCINGGSSLRRCMWTKQRRRRIFMMLKDRQSSDMFCAPLSPGQVQSQMLPS